MNYHNITKDDMLNGDGLRVVLWVAGCEHHCKGCQNPVTWDVNGGLKYDRNAWEEIADQLQKDYISGITFSGGDPLHLNNREQVLTIAKHVKNHYPGKTVWLYTGYEWEDICDIRGIEFVDVAVVGRFVEGLADVKYHWAGSTNQRIVDVKKSLDLGCAIRYGNPIYINRTDVKGVCYD